MQPRFAPGRRSSSATYRANDVQLCVGRSPGLSVPRPRLRKNKPLRRLSRQIGQSTRGRDLQRGWLGIVTATPGMTQSRSRGLITITVASGKKRSNQTAWFEPAVSAPARHGVSSSSIVRVCLLLNLSRAERAIGRNWQSARRRSNRRSSSLNPASRPSGTLQKLVTSAPP